MFAAKSGGKATFVRERWIRDIACGWKDRESGGGSVLISGAVGETILPRGFLATSPHRPRVQCVSGAH